MTRTRKKPPKPGRYEREPFDSYRSWPYLNASALCRGLTSMKAVKAALDGRFDKDTPSLRFGRAFHARLLEPRVFNQEWKVSEPCTAPVKSGAREGQPCGNTGTRLCPERGWLCGTHGRDLPEVVGALSIDDGNKIERMREACMAHDEIKHLRTFPGAETSIVFDVGDVRCKARLDKLVSTPKGSVIIDVKTFGADALSPTAFYKSAVANYAYHVKAAWYLDGLKRATGIDAGFLWIAVETDWPFEVAVFEPDELMLAHGRWLYLDLLRKYRECRDAKAWPGAYPGVITLEFTEWDRRMAEGKEVYDCPAS